MYTIEEVPAKNRIVVIFDRFEDHDRTQFISDIQRAALKVRSSERHFDMLADFTQSMVMPQPIAKDSITLSDWLLENGLRKSANIMVSITQRMQVARVTDHDKRYDFFETRAEGERWLDQPN